MSERSGPATQAGRGSAGRADAASRGDAASGPVQQHLTSSAAVRVGTSGWSYPNWRELSYPRGLKPGDWLGFNARHFATVELNASFYRLPTPAMIERWSAATP